MITTANASDWDDFWNGPDINDIPTFRKTNMTKLQLDTVRSYFTESEWDTLFDAICEFQDHGDEESEMSYNIQSKMQELFVNV
tara:strand:- start:41763 stop:42011 length:249 start_codon:yes stop_codon:yes gene_type:complete